MPVKSSLSPMTGKFSHDPRDVRVSVDFRGFAVGYDVSVMRETEFLVYHVMTREEAMILAHQWLWEALLAHEDQHCLTNK